MAETNLIANIVPQFDASKMEEFVSSMADSISEALSAIDLPSFTVDIPTMPSVKVDTPDSIAVSAPESIALDYNAEDFNGSTSSNAETESVLRTIMQDVAQIASRKTDKEEQRQEPLSEGTQGEETDTSMDYIIDYLAADKGTGEASNSMDNLYTMFNTSFAESVDSLKEANSMDNLFDMMNVHPEEEESAEPLDLSPQSLPTTITATLTSESVNDVVTSTVNAMEGSAPPAQLMEESGTQSSETLGVSTIKDAISDLVNLTINTLTIREMTVGTYKQSNQQTKPEEEKKADVREDMTKRQQELADKYQVDTKDTTLKDVLEQIAKRQSEERDKMSPLERIKETIADFALDKKSELGESIKSGKMISNISNAMIAIPGLITAGIGAVTGVIMGIFTLIKKSTPVLNDVVSLISDAFNMVLQPIGIIIAEQLASVLPAIYERISKWFTEAKVIYEKEGWAGLFKEAIVVAWTMFLQIASTAFSILWDGFTNLPVIGTIVQVGLKIFDYLASNLSSVLNFLKTYISVLVGLKVYEITSQAAKDALGAIALLPGTTLLGDVLGAELGVYAGIGTSMLLDSAIEETGLNDMVDEVSSAYKEFKESLTTTNSYNNSLTTTVSTTGSSTYSSTGSSSTIGNTYNNYWNISGADRDTLVNTIQSEVNKQVKVSRSYLGV